MFQAQAPHDVDDWPEGEDNRQSRQIKTGHEAVNSSGAASPMDPPGSRAKEMIVGWPQAAHRSLQQTPVEAARTMWMV